MQPEHPIQVRTMRVRYGDQCAHCHSGIERGAFLVVVVYRTVGTVWYCVPCAVALGVPRPQAQAAEGRGGLNHAA
jgi:hypothetical protein